MKKVLIIIITLAAIGGAAYCFYTKKDTSLPDTTLDTSSWVTATGTVSTVFEGEQKLNYSFAIPPTATLIQMPNRNFSVNDNGEEVAQIFFSYEGARGYTPGDYVTEEIVNKLETASTGTELINGVSWTTASSTTRFWYINYADEQTQWLIVVKSLQNKKEFARKIAESFE